MENLKEEIKRTFIVLDPKAAEQENEKYIAEWFRRGIITTAQKEYLQKFNRMLAR